MTTPQSTVASSVALRLVRSTDSSCPVVFATMSNVPIFVDLQGFIINERFIVKEMAVLKHGKELTHRMFSAPMNWDLLTKTEKSKVCWLTANHHGLKWNDGDMSYKLAKGVIRRAVCGETENWDDFTTVYVKGTEKVKWLEQILGDNAQGLSIKTIDADFEDIGRLETLNATRSFRCERHATNCAMENVSKLYHWWFERQRHSNV